MPQLVQGWMRSTGTNSMARRMVAATSCGVSILSLATSMTPSSTSLPLSSASRLSGTRELAHSSETWSMQLCASAGKISSYCRHSLPRLCFQSIFALMP